MFWHTQAIGDGDAEDVDYCGPVNARYGRRTLRAYL